MRQITQTKSWRGFTLMELMVVVVIIGILASVAIPMLSRYMKRSKTTEATLNLRKIYDGEISYFQEEHTNSAGASLSKEFLSCTALPATPNDQKQLGDWSQDNWPLLKFAPDSPVFYSYSAVATGINLTSEFTARAEGDIDGDGATSLFERLAAVDSATGEPLGAGAVYSLDALE